MSRCHSVEQLTLPSSVYGLARAATRFSVIVARTGRSAGVACSGSGEPAGVDVETFPGGGEPSAVKSDFCCASVFATGTGATTGLLMPITFAVSRNAVSRAARERRLSLNAHGVMVGRLASLPSPCRIRGSLVCSSRKAIALEHLAVVGCAAGPEADCHIQTSERP
jgi:hypothetical protein